MRVSSAKKRRELCLLPPADPSFEACDRQSRPSGPAGKVILVISVIETTKIMLLVMVGRTMPLMPCIIGHDPHIRKSETRARRRLLSCPTMLPRLTRGEGRRVLTISVYASSGLVAVWSQSRNAAAGVR